MKYRKKPVVIEAVRWHRGVNDSEIVAFLGKDFRGLDYMGALSIATLEGEIIASDGDYVIRGVAGEHYPCKPDIFAATYEPVR
jgi:hypothetical protein